MTTKKKDKNKTTIESARQLFLTLSQTSLTVDEVYDQLLNEEKLEHLAVCLETHTADVNKGKHIHVYLSYVKKRELSLRHFDFLQNGVHVEKVKNVEYLLAYMSKENMPRSNFDPWHKLLSHSKSMASKTLTQMLLLGMDAKAIQVKYEQELCNYPWATMIKFSNEVMMYQHELENRKSISDQLRWIDRDLIEARLTLEELSIFNADPQFQTLVDYVNRVKKYGFEQIHKECCLSIVSQPSKGKSSFMMKLAEHYNNYNFPIDGWHREKYDNNIYAMWTWNEWDIGIVNWSDLMLLLEGFQTDLRIKGSKTVKLDRPMLFLISNAKYSEQYSKKFSYMKRQGFENLYTTRLKALDVRIKELDFGNQNLFFLQKLLVKVTSDI